MLKFASSLLVSSLMISSAFAAPAQQSFFPEGFSLKSKGMVPGLNQEQFNKVIDKVEAIYAPIVAEKGGTLKVERNWTDETVNAYASRKGKLYKVAMFGGLAQASGMTEDAFTLVICHEIGHHIGGSPIMTGGWGNKWASIEGQADYYGSLKCLKKVFDEEDNEAIVAKLNVPETLGKACDASFSLAADKALCKRVGMAGFNIASMFALWGESGAVSFDTPDPSKVGKMYQSHPAAQCRLDTYFAAAVCDASHNVDTSYEDIDQGVCSELKTDIGTRPNCWYKRPSE